MSLTPPFLPSHPASHIHVPSSVRPRSSVSAEWSQSRTAKAEKDLCYILGKQIVPIFFNAAENF